MTFSFFFFVFTHNLDPDSRPPSSNSGENMSISSTEAASATTGISNYNLTGVQIESYGQNLEHLQFLAKMDPNIEHANPYFRNQMNAAAAQFHQNQIMMANRNNGNYGLWHQQQNHSNNVQLKLACPPTVVPKPEISPTNSTTESLEQDSNPGQPIAVQTSGKFEGDATVTDHTVTVYPADNRFIQNYQQN